jgi:hypothetical protein
MCRLICVAILVSSLFGSMGCLPINEYSSDPDLRMSELMNQSEDLRQARLEWRRFWMVDQPSHLSPERIHGGMQ